MATAPHAHYHAVVWMDHREARVFHFNADQADKLVVHADKPDRHLHHKAGSIGGGKAGEDRHYLDGVVAAISGAAEVLLVGPGQAKQEFLKHVRAHHPSLVSRIVGIESVDHPSDGQIVAHARRYFKVTDRMRPQLG